MRDHDICVVAVSTAQICCCGGYNWLSGASYCALNTPQCLCWGPASHRPLPVSIWALWVDHRRPHPVRERTPLWLEGSPPAWLQTFPHLGCSVRLSFPPIYLPSFSPSEGSDLHHAPAVLPTHYSSLLAPFPSQAFPQPISHTAASQKMQMQHAQATIFKRAF